MNPVLKPLVVYFQTLWCPFCAQFTKTVLPPYIRNDMIDLLRIEVKPRYLEYYERYDIEQMQFENPWVHDYVLAGRKAPDRKPSVPCICVLSAAEKLRHYNQSWMPPIGKYLFSGISDAEKQKLAAQARQNPKEIIKHYAPAATYKYDDWQQSFEAALPEYIKSQAQRAYFNTDRREIAKVVPQNRRASINYRRYIHV